MLVDTRDDQATGVLNSDATCSGVRELEGGDVGAKLISTRTNTVSGRQHQTGTLLGRHTNRGGPGSVADRDDRSCRGGGERRAEVDFSRESISDVGKGVAGFGDVGEGP